MTAVWSFEVEWEELPLAEPERRWTANVTLAGVTVWSADGTSAKTVEALRGRSADEQIIRQFAERIRLACAPAITEMGLPGDWIDSSSPRRGR